MYKLLLCWRYLRTRYIALACIISVMLGVATMIVVNAVMEGFTHEMQEKMHGILSDLVFESVSLDGFPDAEKRMAEIRAVAGDSIAGMSPTVHIPAMLGYSVRDQYITKQIMVIGVDEKTYASVSDFGHYLQHPKNREQLDFRLQDGGYDTFDHQCVSYNDGKLREAMKVAGWEIRRRRARFAQQFAAPAGSLELDPFTRQNSTTSQSSANGAAASSPSDAASAIGATAAEGEGTEFDPAKDQHTGCVLGIGLCSYRAYDGSDGFLALPGDDVEISYPTASKPPKVLSAKFTIVDFYESKMGEYDSSFVFAPLRQVQRLRGMIDPLTGVANATGIQIRLKPGADLNKVRDLLRDNFAPNEYRISSWRDKEGAILAAVQIETAILNVLLFLIIAVAGFGILAIFFMIVVEKTRDIGILKSLGASSRGVMGIFLSYGLSLGVVGAGMGLIIGLLFVKYITEIADLLGRLMGMSLFQPAVYGLPKIPAVIEWPTVTMIIIGALGIAILASILPARRAARLHPVEALRYE